MDSHGRANIIDEDEKKVGECKQESGWDNADEGQNPKKEVNSSKSDKLPKMIERFLPTCQLILTRCDGLSCGRVKTSGKNSLCGNRSAEISLAKSDKMNSGPTESTIPTTSIKGCSREQASDDPISTQLGTKQRICLLCSKSFSGQLNRHIRSHTGELPYKCQHCSESFGRMDDLKRHVRIHTGERPYKCQLCSRSFTQKGNLKRHILTHS